MVNDGVMEGSERVRESGGRLKNSGDDKQGEFIEGQGGRRKKGLKEKIKEKLTGGKNKEEHSQAVSFSRTATTTISAGPTGTQQYHDHEKKSVIEKIKDKLPGHHTN
ncbi:embryogenic cell protein 40-like [Fagus crenata]